MYNGVTSFKLHNFQEKNKGLAVSRSKYENSNATSLRIWPQYAIQMYVGMKGDYMAIKAIFAQTAYSTSN